MSGLLQLKSVHLRFGRVQALTAIDLKLAAGERLALIGANGSGKSTLLRVLHGLLRPSSGSVLRDSGTRQAMVFQRPFMLRASVLTNVALGSWIAGRPWKQARQEALEVLARVDLAAVALQRARELSGGQQQRLALARALSLQPQVLLLDEPTSSLDPPARDSMEALMGGLARMGMTLVFASHNLAQVKRLATRVIYLEQGRILVDLPVHDFFDRQLLQKTSPEADLFIQGELA